jgi:hypothetical protein
MPSPEKPTCVNVPTTSMRRSLPNRVAARDKESPTEAGLSVQVLWWCPGPSASPADRGRPLITQGQSGSSEPLLWRRPGPSGSQPADGSRLHPGGQSSGPE